MSIYLSCKICRILLSQNFWNKKSMMMTYVFTWMNVATWLLYNWRHNFMWSKGNDVFQWRNAQRNSIKLFLLPKWIAVAPGDLSNSSYYKVMTSLPPEGKYPEVYLLSKFNVLASPMTGNTKIFKLVILLTLSSSELIIILLTLINLLASQNWPYSFISSDFGQASYFTGFGQDDRLRKTIQTLSVWIKIQKPRIGSGRSHFQWFNHWESWIGFPS